MDPVDLLLAFSNFWLCELRSCAYIAQGFIAKL